MLTVTGSLNVDERHIDAAGVRLNVASAGQGADIVFLHGWCNNWRGWLLLAERLAPHYRLHMLDLPGFGRSDSLPDYDLARVTDILAAAAAQLADRPVLIGASLGTLLAAATVARHPSAAARLVLIGPVLASMGWKKGLLEWSVRLAYRRRWAEAFSQRLVRSRWHAYIIEGLLNAQRFDRARIEAVALPGRRQVTGRAYVRLGYAAFRYDLDHFLVTTNRPVLLLRGAGDSHVNRAVLQQYGRRPHIDWADIPGAGHNPAYEAPAATAAALAAFLTNRPFCSQSAAAQQTTCTLPLPALGSTNYVRSAAHPGNWSPRRHSRWLSR